MKVLLERIKNLPKLEKIAEPSDKSKQSKNNEEKKNEKSAEKRILLGTQGQLNDSGEEITVSQYQLEEMLKAELSKRLQSSKV